MVPGNEEYHGTSSDDPPLDRFWLIGGLAAFALLVTGVALWSFFETQDEPSPVTIEATLTPLPQPAPAPSSERVR